MELLLDSMSGLVITIHVLLNLKQASIVGFLNPHLCLETCKIPEKKFLTLKPGTLDRSAILAEHRNIIIHSRRGSLGPSTVILMALWYVAT